MSRSSSLLLQSLGIQAPELSQEARDTMLSVDPGLSLYARNEAPILSRDQEADQQKAAAEQLHQEVSDNGVGLFAAATTALPTRYLERQLRRINTGTVPGYSVSEDALKVAVGFGNKQGELDPKYWERLLSASSPADLEELRTQAYEQQISERTIAAAGGTGSVVQFAAGFVDPLSLLAFEGAGNVAKTLGAMTLRGRIGSAARNGLVAGAAMAPINAYIATQDPNITAKDVMWSTFEMMGAGAGLGFAFHGAKAEAGREAWVKKRAEAARVVSSRLEYEALKEANGGKVPELGDAGKVKYAEHVQDDLDIKLIEEEVQKHLDAQEAERQTILDERAARLADAQARHAALGKAGEEAMAALRLKNATEGIARTPLDQGGGIGFLPPIIGKNNVGKWIAESPGIRTNFEDARNDAKAARRANPNANIVIAEYPGQQSWAAFREPGPGEKGTGPGFPDGPLGRRIGDPGRALTPEELQQVRTETVSKSKPIPQETPVVTGSAKTEVPPTESQAAPSSSKPSGGVQVGDRVIVYGQEANVVGHTETGFIEVSFDGGSKEAVSPDQVTIKNPDGTTRNAASESLPTPTTALQIGDRVETKSGVSGEVDGFAKDGKVHILSDTGVRSEVPASEVQDAEKMSWLQRKGDEALQRIKDRKGIQRGRNVGGGTLHEDIVDAGVFVATRLAHLGISAARATVEMVAKILSESLPHLKESAEEVHAAATDHLAQMEAAATGPSLRNPEGNGPPRGEIKPGDFSASNVSSGMGWAIGDLPIFQKIKNAPVGEIPYISPALEATRIRLTKLLAPLSEGFGKADRVVRSINPMARKVMRAGAHESVINRAGEKANEAGSVWIDRQHTAEKAKFRDATQAPFESWAERKKGMTPFNRPQYDAEFQEAVTRYRRDRGAGIDNTATTDPDVVAAAKNVNKLYQNFNSEGPRLGIRGFINFVKDPNNKLSPGEWQPLPDNEWYVNRRPLGPKIAELSTKLAPEADGKDGLQGFLERSLNDKGTGWLTDKRRTILAKSYMRLADRGLLTDLEVRRMFSQDNADIVRTALEKSGADQDLIEDTMRLLRPEETRAGMMAEVMKRIDFDETYTEAMKTKAGEEIKVNFQDILENDARKLHERYSRHFYGAVVKNEIGRMLSPENGPRLYTTRSILDAIEKTGREFGQTGDQAKFDRVRLESVLKHIDGLPQEPGIGPIAESVLEDIRQIQRMRVFGMALFKHLGNFGTAMSETHPAVWTETASHIPNITKDVITGKVTDPLMRQLRQIVATNQSGVELGQVANLIDRDATTKGLYAKIKSGLNRGANFIGNITGLIPMIHAQQDIFSLAHALEWVHIAKSGKLPSADRLADLGMNKADAQKIVDAINHPTNGVTFHGTDMGGPVADFNFHKWDPEALATFTMSINKWSRRMALSGDIGQTSPWMDTAIGKSLMQGRFFHAIAWDSRVRHALRMMDGDAARSLAAEMSIGAAGYTMRIHAQAIGRKDRETFLKERLSPENIAKAAFASNGYTSLFPIGIDSVADMTGFYPKQFSYTRTTGMGQSIWENPSLQWSGGMLGPVPKSFVGLITGRKNTQSDMNHMRYLLPGQNALFFGNVMDYLQSRLPKEHKEQP